MVGWGWWLEIVGWVGGWKLDGGEATGARWGTYDLGTAGESLMEGLGWKKDDDDDDEPMDVAVILITKLTKARPARNATVRSCMLDTKGTLARELVG